MATMLYTERPPIPCRASATVQRVATKKWLDLAKASATKNRGPVHRDIEATMVQALRALFTRHGCGSLCDA